MRSRLRFRCARASRGRHLRGARRASAFRYARTTRGVRARPGSRPAPIHARRRARPRVQSHLLRGCHEKPVFGGSASHYRDFLLVGDELAPDTVVPRGKNGVQRQFSLDSARAPSDPLTNISATRNPIPFFGAGLLAEIPDTEIVSHADPDDADGDGISGRVNYDGMLVGRFGRKAQTSRIELFVRGPLFNHMGITSDPLSDAQRAALPAFKARPALRRSRGRCGRCRREAGGDPRRGHHRPRRCPGPRALGVRAVRPGLLCVVAGCAAAR